MIIKNNRICIESEKKKLVIDMKQVSETRMKYEIKMDDQELLKYFTEKYGADQNKDIIEKFLNNAIANQRKDISLTILDYLKKEDDKIFGKVIVWNGEKDKFNIDMLPLRVLDKQGEEVFKGEFKSCDFVKKDEGKVVDIYCELEANIEILEDYKLTY